MKLLLLLLFTSVTCVAQTAADINIMCSPKKDTIYLVQKPQMQIFITIWDLPEYAKDKPVFVYKTQQELDSMSKMSWYKKEEK